MTLCNLHTTPKHQPANFISSEWDARVRLWSGWKYCELYL